MYEKQTWKTGDIITAVKLNHMEDGIANPGYTVETQSLVVVPQQTVETTERGGIYFANLTLGTITEAPQSMTVTFQGQEYECEKQEDERGNRYGGNHEDFSTYPFYVLLREGDDHGTITFKGSIYTESAGTYTVKAEGVLETVTVSEDFTKASVKAVGIPAYTIDDVGEVLMVATDFKTVDTIPEQSVTILAGTSRANLSDVSGLSDTLYINGEPARYSIYGAYQYSNYWFKIDRSASPATIIHGIITGKDDSSMKFEETNADEDITITIRGTGSVQVPVLRWTKTSNSSSSGGQSASITPDDGLNKG